VAKDLIVHAIASVQQDVCHGHFPTDHALPPPSVDFDFLVPSKDLSRWTDFVFVKDTMRIFGEQIPLLPSNRSSDFQLYDDNDALVNRRLGWISTNKEGGAFLEFRTFLPNGCYVLYLAVLKSYNGMGTFTVRVQDKVTLKSFELDVDGTWEPRISIPYDLALLPSTSSSTRDLACTGNCVVTVLTHPQPPNRTGTNKVKIMSFSARTCREEDFS
jgi:hypothetical protein